MIDDELKQKYLDAVANYEYEKHKNIEAIEEITKDKMEQFDDYVIYLLEKYENILKGELKYDI